MTDAQAQRTDVPGFEPGTLARAWHRMRWIGAALVVVLFALYRPPAGQELPFNRGAVLVGFSVAIVAANLASGWLQRRGPLSRPARLALFCWDTAVVLGVVATLAFDQRTAIWALLAFPIVGAAALWKLRGALWTWAAVSAAHVVLRLAFAGDQPPVTVATSLAYRVTILLLIAIFVGTLVQEQAALISALSAAHAELRRRAAHDDLTGLANRTTLLQRLHEAVARAERGGPGPALLFLDCDDFKVINDELGHVAGDAALRMIAERLSSEIRTGDVAARLSGDEFCVLLQTQETVDDAQRLAQRLRRRLHEPWSYGAVTIELGASVGVTVWSPGTTGAQMLEAADQAMYRNKERSRGAVRIQRQR